MAQYDGSVRVNTKLDTTGFDRGSEKLKQATAGLQKKLDAVGRGLEKSVARYEQAVASGNRGDMKRFAAELERAKNAAKQFRQDMESFKTQKFQTDDYKFIQQNIEAAQKALDRLLDRQAKMNETGVKQNSQAYRNLEYDIEQARKKLEQYQADMQALKDSGDIGEFSGAQTAQFQEFSRAADEVDSALGKMEQTAHPIKSAFSSIASSAAKAGTSLLKMAGSAILSGIKKIGQWAAQAAKNLAKMVATKITGGIKRLGIWLSNAAKSMLLFGRNSKKANKNLGGGLMTMLKYTVGIRSLYALARKLTSFIKEGFGNLAQYSGKTNASISLVLSSLSKLKNALAAAFAPIVNIAAPALANLINLLTTATEKIGAFFAALTGQKTMLKAKDAQEDYAASLDKTSKAAEEAKKQLAGFDELNILSADKSQDAAEAASEMFEEVPITDESETLADQVKKAWEDADFSGIGDTIGEKLKNALENIPWNSIKTQAKKLGKSLATLLNGVFETPGLFTDIGKTIAEAINTAFDFIDSFAWNFHWDSLGNAIMDVLEGIADNIDWRTINSAFQGIATGLADLINAIFSRRAAFEKIGRTLGEMLNTVINAGLTLVNRIDFNQIGETIAAGLNSAVSTIRWERIGELLGNALGGALQTLYSVAKNFNWVQFGEGLAAGVNGLVTTLTNRTNGMDWGSVGKSITEGISAMIKKVNWDDMGKLLAGFFNSVLDFIGGALEGFDWRGMAKSLGEFINSVISNVDWAKLGGILSDAFIGFLNFITTAIETIDWQGIGNAIADFMGGIDWGGLVSAIVEGIGAALGGLAALLWGLIEGAWRSVVDWWHDVAFEDGQFTIEGLLDGIIDVLKNIGTWIYDHIFKPFIDGFKKAFGIASPSKVMAEQGGYVVEGLKQGMLDAIANIKAWVKEHIVDKIVEAYNDIKATVQMGVELAKKGWETVKGWVEDVKQWGTELKEKAVSLAKSGWTTVKGWIEDVKQWGADLKEKAVSLAKSGWDTVKSWIETAAQWGGELIQKAVSLAKSGWDTVSKWVNSLMGSEVVQKAVDLIKGKAEGIAGAWDTVSGWVGKLIGTDVVQKGIGLIQSGWNTVKSWVETYTGGDVTKTITANAVKSGNDAAWKAVDTANSTTNQSVSKSVTVSANKTGLDTSWSAVETANSTTNASVSKSINVTANKYGGEGNWEAVNSANTTTDKSVYKTVSVTANKNGTDENWEAVKAANTATNTSVSKTINAYANQYGTTDAWNSVATANNTIAGTVSRTVNASAQKSYSWNDEAYTASQTQGGSVTRTITAQISALSEDRWLNKTIAVTGQITQLSAKSGTTFTITTRALGGILSGGVWKSLPQFANGGIIRSIAQYAGGTLNAGSLFVAGEAGPEVVGHINGRTEVLNKSQIASAIYSAVLAGMETAVNALGRYITSHMTVCTNAVINALAYTRGPSTVTLSVPDAALLQRLSVLADMPYTVPAYATGTVMPYEVVAELRRQTSELKEAIHNAAEEIIQANASAISNHGLALTQAIGNIQTGGGQSYSPEYMAQYTIDEINRRTQMMGRSPLLT